MSTARDVILSRIRSALADVPDVPAEIDSPVSWEYGLVTAMEDVLGVFVDALEDYKATITRVKAAEVPKAIVKALQDKGAESVILPSGIDAKWRKAISDAKIAVNTDEPAKTSPELNEIDAVVTAARVGIASTGTIVLDHVADQGRRALTLVPDIHVCVINADQVVSDVPEAIARLKPSVVSGQPLTFISGGSATSDIELIRVEGVHGPRRLSVILVD
jgi:L-lactate dehydrogenase complex protein LldG